MLLNTQGHTSGRIAAILRAPRSRVADWLASYEAHGFESVLEGQRSGRPRELDEPQRVTLADIIDSGPVAYGLDSGVWTSPMIARVIAEEFGVSSTPVTYASCCMPWASRCNVRSEFWRVPIPSPRTVGDAAAIPTLKKAQSEHRALIFTDEASFRQDSTLHATWSRVGCPPQIPVTGERKSVKILGAVEIYRAAFHYRQDTVFNADTYLTFLEQLAPRYRRRGAILVQDNASYHKDADVWSWFKRPAARPLHTGSPRPRDGTFSSLDKRGPDKG